ncbi:penicillin acylase family protein [Pontibacter sp. G13]|uniref:penicillin acylase family protein n=1 Tax=Pontibacter sp. G13 TaxID=3074898 RepID=UPI00288C2D04|nr:penicillin acylase family protein [Pontibacter sp. G13]WNJ16666.1 penicillin acylase family protein [Pontibacter sp. G13]
MKLFARISFFTILLMVFIGLGGWLFLRSSLPTYSGTKKLPTLSQAVTVQFDYYGIPHIKAQTERDAYRALGYVHAQERLLQMDMIRRVAEGRLSEVLGPSMLETDIFFRTLGIRQAAQQAALRLRTQETSFHLEMAEAYLEGVNTFIISGPTPIEYQLMGMTKEPFGLEQVYEVAGYMAVGFALGFKYDPLLQKIHDKLGPEYLQDLSLGYVPNTQTIQRTFKHQEAAQESQASLSSAIHGVLKGLPTPMLVGSNAWVIGPTKTEDGQAIFANDPHIGFSQPAVWYEAHLMAPGMDIYGYHLAGFPFAPLGHTRGHAIGITMLENDDVNFYIERVNPDNPNQVWEEDHWADVSIRYDTIRIKGAKDSAISIRSTRHGPIVNDAFSQVEDERTISLWWSYLKAPGDLLGAAYGLLHAQDMTDAREAASLIGAPGLNIMYGDTSGNFAWWAAAKLPIIPDYLETKLFLDGASGEEELDSYLPFSANPRAENPPEGFVYSANNQPAPDADGYMKGYFAPQDRALRIVSQLNENNSWSVSQVEDLILDNVSPTKPKMIARIKDAIVSDGKLGKRAWERLRKWDGNHDLESIEPTLYYAWMYQLLRLTLADELGPEDFEVAQGSFFLKRSLPQLMLNDSSVWWNNIHTAGMESREEILNLAWQKAIQVLENRFGNKLENWQWQYAHQIIHEHPIGRAGILESTFNVGPFPSFGGREVINFSGFDLNETGTYLSKKGPSRRTIISMADPAQSISIIPTGQSGHFMSKHYSDQAHLFNEGRFRPQLMNESEIAAQAIGTLVLKPR